MENNHNMESIGTQGVPDFAQALRNLRRDLSFLDIVTNVLVTGKPFLPVTFQKYLGKDAPEFTEEAMKEGLKVANLLTSALLDVPGLCEVIAHHMHNYYLDIKDKQVNSNLN